MKQKSLIQFIQLIRNAVFNIELPRGFIIEDAELCLRLAKQHNMTSLVGYAITRTDNLVDSAFYDRFRNQYYQTISCVTAMDVEIQRIKETLEKNGLDFVLLKGAFIRQLYPARWMRVSSDIDILIREKSLKKAISVLTDSLKFQQSKTTDHDVLLLSPRGIQLELHYVLTRREWKAQEVLDNVWNWCYPSPESKHEYIMKDEFLYFYHVFHAAKHFTLGGCGVRSVLDTYILNHFVDFNSEKRIQILEQGNLLLFANKLEEIAYKWFSDADVTSFDKVEEYILLGGAFGEPQRIAAIQAETRNRKRYILYRLFPPLNKLRFTYPVLTRFPVLLPFCWIHRLFKSLLTGKSGKAKYELEETRKNEHQAEDLAQMYKSLGLQK